MAASGDLGPRKGGRGWMLAFAGGGVALVVVVAVLVLSHHGGQPGTAAAGTGQATTAPGQARAPAASRPVSAVAAIGPGQPGWRAAVRTERRVRDHDRAGQHVSAAAGAHGQHPRGRANDDTATA